MAQTDDTPRTAYMGDVSVPMVVSPLVSLIIPMKDEADNLSGLFEEIDGALSGLWLFEVVAIDDGSTDQTLETLKAERDRWPWLRILSHDRCAGKSAAIRSGALAAAGEFLVTLDADGQNNPADVPAMIALMHGTESPVALVAAERIGRTDSGLKKVASRIANATRNRLLGDRTRDTANGLKAIRRDVYLALPFFDTMHRFFPALVARDGLPVGHVDVVDRARRHGASKYGILDRLAVSVPDLLGLIWLKRRRKVVPRVKDISRDAL